MYSILVAAMGREVVAVDAMEDNLAYIRASLEIGNNTEKVVLVHNAIRQLFIQLLFILCIIYSSSNAHETLYPVAYDDADPDNDQHPNSNKLVDEKEILNFTKVLNNNQPQS